MKLLRSKVSYRLAQSIMVQRSDHLEERASKKAISNRNLLEYRNLQIKDRKGSL